MNATGQFHENSDVDIVIIASGKPWQKEFIARHVIK